jgi:uncharacterized protein (TIGR02996 family)
MNVAEDLGGLEKVFLEEIARGGDETPVLIYADWLMEQDDPAQVSRGEFLRLQSVLRHGRPGAQRSDLEWRARDLWWSHIESWLGLLYDAVDAFRYERGLLAIEVSEATLGAFDAAELAAAPAWGWVRHIGLRQGIVETLAWLSMLPRPPFLSSLDVGRKILDPEQDELPLLLGLRLLQGLTELDLAENSLGDAGAAEVAGWAGAATLRKLGLRRNGIHDAGVEVLAGSVHLGSLEVLDLSDNPVGTGGGSALVRASGLRRLRKLDLGNTDVGWHSFAALQNRYRDCSMQGTWWRAQHGGGG